MSRKVIHSPEQMIKFHQEQMTASEASFVEHAWEAGKILGEKKDSLDHGKWSDWLNEHWHKTSRTASSYIELAQHPREVICGCPSIKEAQKMIKSEIVSDLDQETPANQPETTRQDEEADYGAIKEPDKFEVYEDVSNDKPEWMSNKADVDGLRRQVNELTKAIKDAPELPGFEMVNDLSNRIRVDLLNIKSAIVGCIPFNTCPYCQGNDSDCDGCKGRGWVNKHGFENAPKELQDEITSLSSGSRK